MQNGNNIINKPIINSVDGRFIGQVKGLFLDPQITQLVGVNLGSEGLFSSYFKMIRHEKITMFGISALFVDEKDIILDDSDVPELAGWLKRSDLKGRKIDTQGGTKIGEVDDILFDMTGQILGFNFGKLYVQGTLARNNYISRDSVVEVLTTEGIMTIDLAIAERQKLGDTTQQKANDVIFDKPSSEATL